MTIREYLESLGATQAELTAKVVTRMENAMMADCDLDNFKPDTVLKLINEAKNGICAINKDTKDAIYNAKVTKNQIESAMCEARKQLDDLRIQTAGLREMKINNANTRDAVMAYAATLNATREIFGDANMTESVMTAAIKAGKYIAWRSIMGPKQYEESNRPRIR